MSTLTRWTIGDLTELTQLAADLDIATSNQQYCRHCTVVPVTDTDMCDACITELVEWLEESDAEYYDRIAEETTYQAQFHLLA